MLTRVITAMQQPIIIASPDALLASIAKRLGCAIKTSPTVSGCKKVATLKVASA